MIASRKNVDRRLFSFIYNSYIVVYSSMAKSCFNKDDVYFSIRNIPFELKDDKSSNADFHTVPEKSQLSP